MPLPFPFASVNRAITEEIGEGAHADALRDLALGVSSGGGGSGGGAFPSRYDLSVNSARIEDASAASPRMITGSQPNAAGGFFGGGTGDKAILGFKGHDGLPLSAITQIQWDWEHVAPVVPGASIPHPYVNLIVQLNATDFKILAIDPNAQIATPSLNLGTLTSLGPNKWRFTHVPGTNLMQIVSVFSLRPAGIGPPPVPTLPMLCDPATGLTPVPIAAPPIPPPPPPVSPFSWPGFAFRYSDLLALPGYAAAHLFDGFIGDGGLPGPSTLPTPTPGMILCVGDSTGGTRVQRNILLTSVLLNGLPA